VAFGVSIAALFFKLIIIIIINIDLQQIGEIRGDMDDSHSSSAAAPSRTIQFRGGKVLEGLTRAGEGDAPPQKKFFRSRAHINPLGRSATDSFEWYD
jgi:hypothetical protein